MLMDDLFFYFPKIELHAHLNGCIRESTLKALAQERGVTLSPLLHDLRHHHRAEDTTDMNRKFNTKQRSLQECFEIFEEISKCVSDLKALKRITDEALEDFACQNVAYLELRSTPKILYHDIDHEQKASKRDYIDTILQSFKEFECRTNNEGMIPRYIVSINRAEPTSFAIEHAQLAIEYKKLNCKYIVGLDLSGNPWKNDFNDLKPAFASVREAGLKTSIHFGTSTIPNTIKELASLKLNINITPQLRFLEGEIPCDKNKDDDFATQDSKAILSFRPDRLGHSLLLTDEMFATLDQIKIPVECCPTSNVMTLELAKHVEGDLANGLRRHPRLKHWIDKGYPISINTDDPGVFDTNSTNEFILLAQAFDIKDPEIIMNIIVNSIDQSFESKEFKENMKKSVSEQLKMLVKQYNEGQLN